MRRATLSGHSRSHNLLLRRARRATSLERQTTPTASCHRSSTLHQPRRSHRSALRQHCRPTIRRACAESAIRSLMPRGESWWRASIMRRTPWRFWRTPQPTLTVIAGRRSRSSAPTGTSMWLGPTTRPREAYPTLCSSLVASSMRDSWSSSWTSSSRTGMQYS